MYQSRSTITGITLVLMLGCGGSAVAAQEEETAPAPQAVDDAIANINASSRYAEEIRKREQDFGVYDPRTGEYLLSVGLLYMKEGSHAQAVDAFARALQIQRVNDGLYSDSQVIILEQLIKSNVAAQNWDAVDQNYQMLLWIHSRNYPTGDPRLLPIVKEVGTWKLKAYREKLLSQNPQKTLDEGEELFDSTIDILERQYGENDPILVDALYGHALTAYELTIHLMDKPLDKFQGRNSPDTVQQVCTPIIRNGIVVGSRCRTIRIPNTGDYVSRQQQKSFTVGVQYGKVGKALKQVVAIYQANPHLPVEEHANALVHLADWNLIQGRRGTALQHYKEAYDLLATETVLQEHRDKLLGKPRSIPSLKMPLPKVEETVAATTAEPSSYAVATFDVSKTGKPMNIEIVEITPPDNISASRQAKKAIKARRYRPKFIDGEPVESTGFKIKIVL